MLSGDCRGLERDRQGQSEPKKGGESRGAGPELCHLGLASSLPHVQASALLQSDSRFLELPVSSGEQTQYVY